MDVSIFDSYVDIVLNNSEGLQLKSKLVRLFQVVLDEALKDERIHFTSLFSKLAYLGVKYDLSGPYLYELHQLRRSLENPESQVDKNTIQLLKYIIPKLYCTVIKCEIPRKILDISPLQSGIDHYKSDIAEYIPSDRFLCIRMDKQANLMLGFLASEAEIERQVLFDISDRNDRFTQNLEQISENELPLLIELIEIERGKDGFLRPAAFVIQPDFLVDVTSIASCFDHSGTKTVSYIYRKFLPLQWSKALLMGNIANYFLDRLVNDEHLGFDTVLQEVFQLDPLSFARIEDQEMMSLLVDMRKHFANIKSVIQLDLPNEGISSDKVYLEPSFISPVYGLQGRLDMLQLDVGQTSIVELKSGKIFKPNVYGLKNDHYTQTLLYDLLIRSAFPTTKPKNYILYSKESTKSLRLAPRIAAQQKEAMKVRNDLLRIEMELCDPSKLEELLVSINTKIHDEAKGFEERNIHQFELTYQSLDRLERDYFNVFVNFIALEHRYSKIGEYGQDRSNGLAGLWLDSDEEKCEQFNMLKQLRISSNSSGENDPIIEFEHTEFTNKLSNFRAGDIIVLYPQAGHHSVLRNQVFKCTIIEFDDKSLRIRLRSQQKNQEIFTSHELWAIEHDMMDSSFISMYRQLFEWAGAPKSQRELLLARIPPKRSETINRDIEYESLTREQCNLLQNMVHAPDYYLVWGPPGTGKTSRIISHYIKYIIDHTDENLYIIAYTNRAVDEICLAIESLGEDYSSQYVRIGSRYGTSKKFTDRLLQSKIEGVKRRKNLREVISSHRLVVGTLSSVISKELVFSLIPPSRVIVDEASQILEPNLVGLLSRFEQFVLVGDHKQLPAVVIQDEEESKVQEVRLNEIGLHDRRNSLFERLYLKCLENKWSHAVGQLQYQGRMHEDIMKFPNENFYDNSLKVLPILARLKRTDNTFTKDFDSLLQTKRMMFKQVDVPLDEMYSKTNVAEANAVVDAVKTFLSMGYEASEIGVITPFRAQIAAIRDRLASSEIKYGAIHVDTVERFQGAAMDVIIVSFCCNSPLQFRSMISLSQEGVDRKLNVALTRAKEQMLLVGDRKILGLNPIYDHLLDYCVKI